MVSYSYSYSHSYSHSYGQGVTATYYYDGVEQAGRMECWYDDCGDGTPAHCQYIAGQEFYLVAESNGVEFSVGLNDADRNYHPDEGSRKRAQQPLLRRGPDGGHEDAS